MTELNGQRVLVTGGAGLVGSHVVDRLVAKGAKDITVVDNLTRGRRENLAWAAANGPVRLVEGDIRDISLVGDLMKGVDTLFHLAAIRITQCDQDPRLAHEVLATGSYNLIEAAVNAGVRKVVASSSASVYGPADVFPTDEQHHPYNNRTIYGAAKLYLEGLLRSFALFRGLNYVALRYFNVYGPRMDAHGAYTEVMVRWMEKIEAGEPPLIYGDGSTSMDFVCVEDVARANLVAAESDVTDEVFNVASGTETSLKELASLMLKVMGSNRDVLLGVRRKADYVPRRLGGIDKAERLLGFRAQVSLEEGLEKLVAWWRSERARAHG